MEKVTVFDHNNQLIGETFPRRAKQLVKKERAYWQDDKCRAICLLEEADWLYKEDAEMEISNNNENSAEINESSVEVSKSIETSLPKEEAATDEVEKDLLMYLAKRNIRLRYNLVYHIIMWPVAFIVIFFITSNFRAGAGFYLGFFFAWGLLILHKFYVLIRIWLGGRSLNVDPVKVEYERLKTIPTEKIEAELKKL